MKAMNREAYLEDLEDLFERQPDPIPPEAALAILGYLKGLRHAGVLSRDDYRSFWDRLPLNGEDMEDAGVNI